jgi:hypothetical protein
MSRGGANGRREEGGGREEGLVTDGLAVIKGRGKASANGVFCNRAISMRAHAVSLDYLYCKSRWRHAQQQRSKNDPEQTAAELSIGYEQSNSLRRVCVKESNLEKWDF